MKKLINMHALLIIGVLATPWSIQSQSPVPNNHSSALKKLESAAADDIDTKKRFLFDCLPGGRYGSSLTIEEQTLAMQLLAKGQAAHQNEFFFKLDRIQKLTPSAELKKAVRDILASIPEDRWPEGYGSLKAGASAEKPDAATMAKGREVYMRAGICVTCHQVNGKGLPAAFPPLAGSLWLDGDSDRLIKIVLKGMIGPLKVGGKDFNSAMLPLEAMLKDDEVAAVLSYVNNEWGNEGPSITPEQVRRIRNRTKDRTSPWSVDEILKLHPLKN